MKKICGWRAVYATVTKAYKLTRLIRKQTKVLQFLIREFKIGTNILNGTKKKSSEKHLAVGQPFKP